MAKPPTEGSATERTQLLTMIRCGTLGKPASLLSALHFIVL